MSRPLESVMACIKLPGSGSAALLSAATAGSWTIPRALEVQNADIVIRHAAETFRQSSDKAHRVGLYLPCSGTD